MLGLLAAAFLVGPAAVNGAGPHWKLVHEETFDRQPEDGSWVKDPMGAKSPWEAGSLDDDGRFFVVNGGGAFRKQLRGFGIYRKRLSFGWDGWLTAEFAARDANGDGLPDSPPSLTMVPRSKGGAARLWVPDHRGGLLIRNTRPLPPRYRVEVELVQVDFGGRRRGKWDHDGRVNGYAASGAKTAHPWSWGADALPGKPYEEWPDVRGANGFYYLAIVDYPDPAPHNNVFIHTRRKAVMDGYNAQDNDWETCDPATGKFHRGQDNAVNAFFVIPGTRLEGGAVMHTECGIAVGGEGGRSRYIGAAELRPELMPRRTYRFAVERDDTGYTLELSGLFRFSGQRTLRYRRAFVQDGRPIWHYNQTPEEYDGSFDETWTYEGPYGRFAVHSWPEGSAYPDYFIIGDPHINYYEGSAVIDDIRLFLPSGETPAAPGKVVQ